MLQALKRWLALRFFRYLHTRFWKRNVLFRSEFRSYTSIYELHTWNNRSIYGLNEMRNTDGNGIPQQIKHQMSFFLFLFHNMVNSINFKMKRELNEFRNLWPVALKKPNGTNELYLSYQNTIMQCIVRWLKKKHLSIY